MLALSSSIASTTFTKMSVARVQVENKTQMKIMVIARAKVRHAQL
jgi:hypothetical protein